MKTTFLPQKLSRLAYLLFGAFETFAFVAAFSGHGVSAASCTPPTTDYGTDTVQQSVATAGTYTIWSHIFAPTGSTGSYMLEVDDSSGGATCYSVGGSSVAANTWTWVNWQNTPSSVINANLGVGDYTFKLIGNSPSVKLDSLLLTTDTTCSPIDNGSNCSLPAPQPTVNLTASPTSVTTGDSSTLTWSSTDADSCDSSWNGTQATSGTASTGALNATTSFTLTCTGTGGTASQTATVTVTPPDNGGGGGGTNPTAPTVSLGLQDGATVSGTTNVTVTPSSDVTQVVYAVDGATVNTTTTAPFGYSWDTTQVSNGVHSLTATASNASGGTASASVSVAVQNTPANNSGGDNSGDNSGGSGDTGGSDNSGGGDLGGVGDSGGGFGDGNSFGLNAPTNVAVSVGALDNTSLSYPVTVTWASTDSATGYDIVLDGVTIDEVNSGDTTSYDYMLPADGGTHTFQVIAFDDFGDVSDLSDGASADAPLPGDSSGNTTVTAPTDLQAVPSGKARQVNLTWTDDDPSAKSYAIYRGNGSNPGSYTKVGTSKTKSYGDTGVKAGSTYSYYVVAVNASGDQSDQSSAANATVPSTSASGGVGKGGTLVGIVKGSDGHKPIIGGRIMFTLDNKTYVFTTNGDGVFVLPNLNGPYAISFSAPGYKASTNTIQVNGSGTTEQNVTLTRNSAGGSSAWKHWDFWNYL